MDISPFTVIYFAFTFLLIWLSMKRRRASRAIWPKGPPGLPLVGHLFHFGPNALDTLKKYHEKYGKTIYLNMAGKDVIICGDGDLVKKYFQRDTFNIRPDHSFMNVFSGIGIIHYNHEMFRVVKRMTMKALKSVGFSGTAAEPWVQNEVDHFIRAINEKRKDGPIRIVLLTGPAASNVVSRIVVGERFDYEHETRKKLDTFFVRGAVERPPLNYLGYINFVESVRYLTLLPFEQIKRTFPLQKFVRKYIEDRVKAVEANFNPETDEPTNYIECFLKECHEGKDDPTFNPQYHTKEILIQNCYAFFVAGSATTQQYLEWWFLAMGMYPEVQEKMFNEINIVFGKERATLSQRQQTPYTEAVISEVHRWASSISLNLPHAVDEDTEFGDYFLPKGTQIIVNFYHVHRDPDNFDDPYAFKPERFLTAEGKYRRLEKLMPFGFGKRSCAGEPMAQMELYLFTITTLQNFRIKLPSQWNGKTLVNTFAREPSGDIEIVAEPRE